MRLWLLRHGETVGNGGFRGRLDEPLSAAGLAQMKRAIQGEWPWRALISSPLQRCRVFAEELARRLDLPLRLEADFRELDFGDWEGRTGAELMVDQAHELGEFWRDPYGFTPPGGEPVVRFRERILAAVQRCHADPRDSLLITHGGVMRLLLAAARGLPKEHLLQVEVPHAALHCIELLADGGLRELPCTAS